MFNNLNSTLKKILVVFLIITLTYANFVLIGTNIVQGLFSYATEEGEENVATENEDNGETVVNEEEESETEIVEETPLLNIENKDIHKTTISEEGEVEYTENLILDLSNIIENSNITVEDILNQFYNNDESLNEEITLTYKTTTINKEDLIALLGEEGKLVITDTVTNKVAVELTSAVLSSQEIDEKVEQNFIIDEETSEEETRSIVTVTEETVAIEYEIEISNIKIELTTITVEQSTNSNEEVENQDESETGDETTDNLFTIKNTKNISNITDIDNLDYLNENIKYVINEEEVEVSSKIKFKDTITRTSLEVDNTEWVVGEANTVNYTITLDTTTEKSELFVNPMFLVELPSSVESINTSNSQFTVNNDNKAFTSKNVFVTTVLGRKFVVIKLEGEQTAETIANGDTTINLSLELNISSNETEGNETTKLYYQNDTVTAYESGKSFDTAQVTVDLIMESEPKEEIVETVLQVYMETTHENVVKALENMQYKIYITNYNTRELQDVQLIDYLPEGVTLEGVVEITEDVMEKEVSYEYDEETRKLTVNLGTLEAANETEEAAEEAVFLDINPSNRILKITVKANALEEGIYSKEIKNLATVKVENTEFQTNEVTNTISDAFLEVEAQTIETSINENEKIEFEVRISNKGLVDAYQLDYMVDLPENIELIIAKYGIVGETSSEGTASGNKYKQTLIDVPAEKTYYIKLIGIVKDVEETENITITGTMAGQEVSWTTEIVDVPKDPENPANPEDSEEPADPENPDEPEEPADSEDSEESADPEEPENPDNLEDKIEGFDLSLNQYLNKVTVINEEGTTTYDYTDTNFAKVEIHAKQMNGSKITLEYKIVVKNNGTIPGYARKIVDYIPGDLIFNESLNKDWFVGYDGNIYSVALIDELINPGETVELTIILEKQMTNDNIGTIVNTVEIYEASNDEELEDINSIPGDKLEGQNDMSKVEVLVAVKTGTVILYITLAIIVITIIGLGFYEVKKITLNKKEVVNK